MRRPAADRPPLPAADAVADGYAFAPYRLKQLLRLARTSNWDLREGLDTAGILGAGRPGARHTAQNVAILVEHLRIWTADELFGLGRRPVPLGTGLVLAFALCSAPDIGTAVGRYEQCRPAFPGMPSVQLSDGGEGSVSLSIDVASFTASVDLLVDGVLAVAHQCLSWATRRTVRLRRVELPHPPPAATSTDYHAIFGAPVAFSSSHAAIVFDHAVLAEPILRGQADIEALLSDPAGSLLSGIAICGSHSDHVRRIIEARVGRHPCTADDIAASVGMSRQTLHRRLFEENTSVSAIKEQVLRDAAIASLSSGRESVVALSHRLGFSEPSAFIRAFRRWTGAPPSRYRAVPHGGAP